MDSLLITYDVPDDKRRLKLANVLEDYGHRVQFSVFEVWVDAALARELRRRIAAVIDDEADSIRIYALCARCVGRVEVIGVGSAPPSAPGVIIL